MHSGETTKDDQDGVDEERIDERFSVSHRMKGDAEATDAKFEKADCNTNEQVPAEKCKNNDCEEWEESI